MKSLFVLTVISMLGTFAQAQSTEIYNCSIASIINNGASEVINQDVLAASSEEAKKTVTNMVALSKLGYRNVILSKTGTSGTTYALVAKSDSLTYQESFTVGCSKK